MGVILKACWNQFGAHFPSRPPSLATAGRGGRGGWDGRARRRSPRRPPTVCSTTRPWWPRGTSGRRHRRPTRRVSSRVDRRVTRASLHKGGPYRHYITEPPRTKARVALEALQECWILHAPSNRSRRLLYWCSGTVYRAMARASNTHGASDTHRSQRRSGVRDVCAFERITEYGDFSSMII